MIKGQGPVGLHELPTLLAGLAVTSLADSRDHWTDLPSLTGSSP